MVVSPKSAGLNQADNRQLSAIRDHRLRQSYHTLQATVPVVPGTRVQAAKEAASTTDVHLCCVHAESRNTLCNLRYRYQVPGAYYTRIIEACVE